MPSREKLLRRHEEDLSRLGEGAIVGVEREPSSC
jgi:hypothetical protein